MERIVMSSNQIDSHGDRMTKEALEGAVKTINASRKLPYNMNHRRELPPLGIMADGQIEERKELVLLTAAPMLFSKHEMIEIEGVLLVKESFDEELLIVSRYEEGADELSISLDPTNFTSVEEFERLNSKIYAMDKSASLEMHGRKSQIPAPELIISVAAATELAKFIIKKISEDVVDDFYEAAKKKIKEFGSYAASVAKLTREKAVPKNKRLSTIFEIHTQPFIELVVKSDDPSLISKGLNPNKLIIVRKEIQKFSNHFDIDKIQFILSDTGNWKFNFLITNKGEVIGQKSTFEERDKQYKRFEIQSETLAAHRFNKPLFKNKNGKK
ncbi:MAG: hypothetical protein ABI741_00030 [Ferruginibacter sp.]